MMWNSAQVKCSTKCLKYLLLMVFVHSAYCGEESPTNALPMSVMPPLQFTLMSNSHYSRRSPTRRTLDAAASMDKTSGYGKPSQACTLLPDAHILLM